MSRLFGAQETMSGPDGFRIEVGRVAFAAWVDNSGRWHYHRRAGGRTTDSASYASRRSCRRAILTRIARGDV